MPQNATVGLVGGLRDNGAIGTQEEPAVFRRKLRAWRVLRREATLPLKWIAARVQIGTVKGAKPVLYRFARGQYTRKPARVGEPDAQLEFQSMTPAFRASLAREAEQ